MNSAIYTTIKNSGKVNNKKTFIQLFFCLKRVFYVILPF